MIRTSKEAMSAAQGQTRNEPGTCQKSVRTWFNAPSAGDQDHDGDADAVDGWLSEPQTARHSGDRNPPAGKPLAFGGGSKGFGHRALSMTKGVRSTDMSNNTYKAGVTSTVTGSSTAAAIAQIERSMGVHYLGWSETIDGLRIPGDSGPLPPPIKEQKVKRTIAHVSLQFSDGSKQHAADIQKIFSQGWDHITGTEAGPGSGNTNEALEKAALKYGYFLNVSPRFDTWVAVKKSVAKPKTLDLGYIFAFYNHTKWEPKPPGKWSDKAVMYVNYEDKNLGKIAVGSIHTLTVKGAGKELKAETDAIYMKKVGQFGRKFGKDHGLAFVAGDFNKVDKLHDLFQGEPFTTCWDELKLYPNTGHGNIDAIASWDEDVRVKCTAARALDDKNFFLHTDHFAIVSTYEIRVLAGD